MLGLLAVAFMALGTLCPCPPGAAGAAGAPCCDLCPPSAMGSCCPTGSGVCWTGSGQGVAEDESRESGRVAGPLAVDFLPPSDPWEREPADVRFIDIQQIDTHSIIPVLLATEHLRI